MKHKAMNIGIDPELDQTRSIYYHKTGELRHALGADGIHRVFQKLYDRQSGGVMWWEVGNTPIDWSRMK